MVQVDWVKWYLERNPTCDAVTAGQEFMRRVKLPLQFFVDNGNPDAPELAEIVGKYVDLGERNSNADELKCGVKDIKKDVSKDQVAALLGLQGQNSAQTKW